MKTKSLRAMNEADLQSKLTELKKELVKHNTQIATGTVPKSPGLVKQTKKNIARILTILGERKNKEEGKKA